jgi:hypothetical protein
MVIPFGNPLSFLGKGLESEIITYCVRHHAISYRSDMPHNPMKIHKFFGYQLVVLFLFNNQKNDDMKYCLKIT